MTAQEKKKLVETKMQEGDKRSYNELMADLELQLWSDRFKAPQQRKTEEELVNQHA